MTLTEIKDLFAYNAWANRRIFDTAAQIPAEQYLRDQKGSHGSIHGTLTHLVAAEKIWLSRWAGNPEKTLLRVDDVPTLRDLTTVWEQVHQGREKFLDTLTDNHLADKFTMKTTKGDTYIHTYAQMMSHLVNHSTYHRGQAANMMRQLGFTPPATDLIAFYRRNQL